MNISQNIPSINPLRKLDIFLSAFIGLVIAASVLLIIKNIEIESSLFIWLIVIFPILAVFGLWLTHFIGRKWKIIYQVGKYILVGSFNTFIDLGVLNLLILISGVAVGVSFSIFKAIAFAIAF